ncbi:MAG: selenate reductase, partial [Clostridiales Family XIII bacterium]|nr:selenate reductase [Clostridiales Family XIII bacterium]
MSEMMRPMAFGDLVETALAEYEKSGSIFGIPQEKFYGEKGDLQVCKPVKVCGTKIGSPIGPAAGPHTQLAQNIL